MDTDERREFREARATIENYLHSIDQRLLRLEDKATRAEATFAGFLAGPGKKLLRLFGGGDLCARPR